MSTNDPRAKHPSDVMFTLDKLQIQAQEYMAAPGERWSDPQDATPDWLANGPQHEISVKWVIEAWKSEALNNRGVIVLNVAPPKPHFRLHVRVGKQSGELYWRVLRADHPNPEQSIRIWSISAAAAIAYATQTARLDAWGGK